MMTEFLTRSTFWGAFLSLMFYEIGVVCKKKWKLAILNPLLIAILLTVLMLIVFRIPYETYNVSAKYLSYLLTPATVCLAIPLYEQIELLKKNVAAILAGIFAGVLTALGMILLFAIVLRLSHTDYVTLLPKSITTAIGMELSRQMGGDVSITVAMIIITGVLGNIIAEPVCKLFRITDPVARGVGIGTAAHAVGTAKAMEMGEVEGAMSGLSVAVAGVLTVFASIVFANLH